MASRDHESAPHSYSPPVLRGKGKGVGRVREGRGKNFWGPFATLLAWFVPAPPALHLPLKKLADSSPNSTRPPSIQPLIIEAIPKTIEAA